MAATTLAEFTPTVLQILSFGCMAALNKPRLGFVLGCIHSRGGASIGIDADYVCMCMQCCADRRGVEIDDKQSIVVMRGWANRTS